MFVGLKRLLKFIRLGEEPLLTMDYQKGILTIMMTIFSLKIFKGWIQNSWPKKETTISTSLSFVVKWENPVKDLRYHHSPI